MFKNPLGRLGRQVLGVLAGRYEPRQEPPASTSCSLYSATNCYLMILRNRSACAGKQPKLSCTVAMDVMPSATAALTSNSLGSKDLAPQRPCAPAAPAFATLPTPTPLKATLLALAG